MSIEGIIQKIEDEAGKESAAILKEASDGASAILSMAQKELSLSLEDLDRKLVREKGRMKNIHLSDGKRKARKAVLEMKESLIMDAFSSIRRRMGELNGDDLSSLLLRLMANARGEVGQEVTIYPVRQEDLDAVRGEVGIGPIVQDTKDLPWQITRMRSKDLIGGFIAISSDGNRVLDMSFNGLLERDEEGIREMISRMLFSDTMG
ncbi:MAG: V-type ATP synthase subunit E [Thermoplasmata archaeon]|nr:V-type ATP synthase subunit E [Thermoplasmata archaeon]